MELIIYVKLIAIRQGNYTLYVFKDLSNDSFIMCTRLPNWQTPEIEVGEEGFLKYQNVVAGEEYFEPATGIKKVYNYTNTYFINFIQKPDKITNSNIIL